MDVSHTKSGLFAGLLIVVSAASSAQTRLEVGTRIDVQAPLSATYEYVLELQAGDYATIAINQQDDATLAPVIVRDPGGQMVRAFPVPPNGRRQFSFVGERDGLYGIEVRPAQAKSSGGFDIALIGRIRVDERLRPGARPDRFASPRLMRLRQELAAGGVTDAFWSRVRTEGTPMIEPSAVSDRYRLVTFLWRGDATTRNVLVSGSFPPQPLEDRAMNRLGDSDVWYLTMQLPADARFLYTLSPNDPMVSFGPLQPQRQATNQADPLNPKRILYREGMSKFEYSSVAELPHAAPQPWSEKHEGTPTGRVENHSFTSKVQKLERPLWVYTPAGYRRGGSNPGLVVLFDAGVYVEGGPIPAATILDNLIAAGRIPPVIAVMVGNVGNRRTQDLSPNPEFETFVISELVPWIRARFSVTTDPRKSAIGGASLGGLAATALALRHPQTFGRAFAQSGSFWWAPDHNNEVSPLDATTDTNWAAKQVLAFPRLPVRFHLDAGSFESDITGSASGVLESTRHLRDVLLAKGYTVHYQQFSGGHDYLGWRGTLADGLMALLGQ